MKKMKIALLLSALAISGTAMADLNTGLVAYYCFDDAKNLGKDCSTNGNNGTAEGVVTSVTGYKGMGVLFGGFNNPADIHIPNSTSLQFKQDFSLAFAVKMTGLDGMNGYGNYSDLNSPDPAFQAVISKSSDTDGMALVASHDGKGNLDTFTTSFEWGNNGIGGITSNSGIGRWVHFTYIFSNTQHTAKLYADGVLISTKKGFTQDFSSINTQDLYLGKYSSSWYPLNGAVDEVRIYNRALTTAEITSLYNQGGSVSGTIKRLNSYSVTCKNDATGQIVVIPATNVTAYNCEASGLRFTPKQNVTVTISGKTY
jgi:hypothetical protein